MHGLSRRTSRSYVCVADLAGSNYGSESGNRGSRSSEFTRGTMNRSSMPRGGSPRVPLSRNGFEITARQWNCCNLVGPFRWMDSPSREGKERGEKKKKKKKMEKDFLGTVGTSHLERRSMETRHFPIPLSRRPVLRASVFASHC